MKRTGAFFAFLLVACGSSSSPSEAVDSGATPDVGPVDSGAATDSGRGDADGAADGDAYAPSVNPDVYPAFAPNAPQIQKQAGAVNAAPEIVTITFPGDPNAATYERFGDALGESDYWKKVATEYGVGKTTSGAALHVRLPDPMPATLVEMPPDQAEISGWLTALFTDPAKNGLPAHDPANVYVIYADPKSSITDFGEELCAADHHLWALVNVKKIGEIEYPYILTGQCDFGHGIVDTTTANVSSLITSVVTTPPAWYDATSTPSRPPAWDYFDDAHLADAIFHENETDVGDVCQFYPQAFIKTAEPAFAFGVLREWSNAGAAAGHDPCVPAAPAATKPYFDVVPLGTETITPTVEGTKLTTQGFALKIGETKTFQVGFFSDAKSDEWTLTTTEKSLPPLLGYFPWTRADNLQVTIDRKTGKNGDVATVTVKPLTFGLGAYGRLALLTFVSTMGGESHYRSVLFMPTP